MKNSKLLLRRRGQQGLLLERRKKLLLGNHISDKFFITGFILTGNDDSLSDIPMLR